MHIQFAELPVFDQDRAQRFYIANFNCTVAADTPIGADGWRWIELALPGADTALHFLRRADEAPADEPVLVFVDRDVAGRIAALRTRGVEILSDAQPAPYDATLTVAEFRDSEGNRLVISSPQRGR